MNLRVLSMLMRPAPGSVGVIALPAVAFAIVTALILTVLGGAQTFWTWTDDLAGLYQALAAIALVLLIVPLVNLGGAAARLSARRRDERLSTLRLLGVTPAGVGALTIVESAVVAALGAVAGIVLYLGLVPLIGLIPFRGEVLGAAGVLLAPLLVVLVIVGIVLLAVVSAVVGLRRVIISPLGVRMRSDASGAHWLRGILAGLLIIAAFLVANLVPSLASVIAMLAVCVALFVGTLAVLGLLGPWVLKVRAGRQLRRAETPQRLLAARTVLNDPKAAWRQVSGVAMASFMAVFAGTGVSLLGMIGSTDAELEQRLLADDMRTGLIITLVGSFLMVACSVGVNQAASILDNRELHRSLHSLGLPADTMDEARRRAIMSPLLTTTVGSAICAFLLIFPIVGVALVSAPASMITIAAVLVVGIGLVWASTRATTPLLNRDFAAV